MKLPWRTMLTRFLPGIVCLAMTLAFLLWSFEPRPTSILFLPLDSRNHKLQFTVSPDEQYLATWREEFFSTHWGRKCSLSVHDLRKGRQVYSSDAVLALPRFDADGTLAFLTYQANTSNRQLVRMQPDGQQKQVIWENTIQAFQHLDLEKSQLQLTTDSRTLLHLFHDLSVVHVILIDGLTGITRCTIEISNVQPSTMSTGLCIAAFSPDSKRVALQTLEGDPHARKSHWRWIDVQTGQVLNHATLPDEMNTEGLLYASQSSPMATAKFQGKRCLVYLKGNQVCTKDIADIPPPDDFDGTKQSHFVYHMSHPLTEHDFVVCHSFDMLSAFNGSGGDSLARHYAFCQGIESDTLGRTTPAIFKPWNSTHYDFQHWFFVAAIPGPYLVFQYHADELDKLQEWIKTIRSWLGIPQETTKTLHFIHGKTGKFLHRLRIPHAQAASLSKDQSKLMILNSEESHSVLRIYDFPLRLPWLSIGSWALTVTAGFVLLLEGIKWVFFSRRRCTH